MLGGIVRGKITTLRTPREEDLPLVNRWMADMRVRSGGQLWDEPATLATWKERLTEVAKERSVVLWTIEAEGRATGTAKVELGWNEGVVDVSHFVIDPEHWRRGYGWDAALALHRYFFDYLTKTRAYLELAADNAGGLRIAERLGYREYGRGHQMHYRDGAYIDGVWLRFDRETWDERWSAEREYPPLTEAITR
jgi:RimJ/RimL family protein N-acetyltransferase